ncbi:F-box/WD repeat-containing protein 7 [Schistosoma japonicum]|nr:F-box/WD repeat-containing protein 7 [Schistosoma japonicum]KAH8862062.1 F-box/WD repeat-containing protein 7 [Schistosoma japonicum]KAH8862065.1 F-box/WD repeat-containing protein 7 [Schistosoma japonicum]
MKSENGSTLPFTSDTLISLLSHNLELNLKPHQVLQLIKKLSVNLTGQQKANLLEHLMGLTTIGHFESLRLATHLHSSCQRVPDCCDFVTWLPAELTLRIFSYLSWKSLTVCSEVNKSWLKFARHPKLYQHLCMLPKWSSPILKKPHNSNFIQSYDWNYSEQEENIRNSNGFVKNHLEINWLNVFKKRVCLRRNFRLGKHRIRRFNGHNGAVYCVDCDAYRIVSGSADATIRVWNIRTNAKWSVQTLRGHSDAVRCVQLLPLPHCQLDSNTNNNNHINAHCSSPPVHCIHESIASIPCSLCKLDPTITYPNCWEPPEVLLISGSADTTLKLWRLSATSNWSRIACTCTLQGHTGTVRCVQADHEKVISGSYDCTIRLWCIISGQMKRTFRGHSAGITCLVYSDNFLYSGSLDNTVRIWNISTGVCYHTLIRPIYRNNLTEAPSFSSPVSCLHLDYSQNRLVVAYHDGTVLVKYLSVFNELIKGHKYKINTDNTSSINNNHCSSITLSFYPSTIYFDGYLYKTDYKSGSLIRCLTGDAWHIICCSDDKSIKVWQVDDNKFVNSLKEHEDGVTCAVISGSVIVSGSYDKTVILYDFDVI